MGTNTPDQWSIKAQDISLIVYDFDGVMTDNTVILSEDGKESVVVNRSDGLAVGLFREMSIRQLILSREKNPVVLARSRKLNIPVKQAVDNKELFLQNYCREENIPLTKVVYIGNDVNDVNVMRIVGFPLCPQDAYAEAKAAAKFVIPIDGGKGVVRCLMNHIIRPETHV